MVLGRTASYELHLHSISPTSFARHVCFCKYYIPSQGRSLSLRKPSFLHSIKSILMNLLNIERSKGRGKCWDKTQSLLDCNVINHNPDLHNLLWVSNIINWFHNITYSSSYVNEILEFYPPCFWDPLLFWDPHIITGEGKARTGRGEGVKLRVLSKKSLINKARGNWRISIDDFVGPPKTNSTGINLVLKSCRGFNAQGSTIPEKFTKCQPNRCRDRRECGNFVIARSRRCMAETCLYNIIFAQNGLTLFHVSPLYFSFHESICNALQSSQLWCMQPFPINSTNIIQIGVVASVVIL